MPTLTPMTDAELARLGTDDDQGIGALTSARGHLPLVAMRVDARVTGLTSGIDLEQTFANTLAEPIEATYIFPLPDRAAVTRFRMEVAGRVIDGVIDERAAARRDYDEAIAAGHRAAIAEEDRPGVFSLRVGNLMPGELATIHLTLAGPVPVDAGEATFRFPLVVAPRYIPGDQLPGPSAGLGVAADTDAVPDASRITPPVLLPGFPNPVRLAIGLTIDGAGVPIDAIRSSLHEVDVAERDGARRIELRPGERLDRDFIVRWRVGDAAVRSSLAVARDEEGEGGTFALTLVPPAGAADATPPRDVVFVIDRSGSMGGWKMVAARRAVARMVDTLGARDRFAVLAFDTYVDTPPGLPGEALAAATDRHRFRAVEFLAGLGARGGTEMSQPLARAADLLGRRESDEDRERVLVLATDGQVGNEDEILRTLGPRLHGTRTFTLGIDRAVNAAFLRRLAAAGGGTSELVETEDRLDEVMERVHRRIGTPVVTDLRLAGDGLDIEPATVAPARLPALFAEAPLTIAGRVRGALPDDGHVEVTGRLAGGGEFRERVPVASLVCGGPLPAVWARARIRDLEDRYLAGDPFGTEHDALEREIVRTSITWSVLSRFTAFLAVDREHRATPGDGAPRSIVQAVEHPSGWNADMVLGSPPAGMPAPTAAASPAQAPFDAAASAPMPAAGGAVPKRRARRAGPAFSSRPDTGADGAPPPPPLPVGPARTASEETPIDATPYRERATRLADAIDAALSEADAPGLGLGLERLAQLAEDVRAIGGLDDLADALAKLLDRARAAIDDREALAVVARELRTLGETPPSDAAGGGTRRFWKTRSRA